MHRDLTVILSKIFSKFITLVSEFISTLGLKAKFYFFSCAFGRGLLADGKVVVRMDKKCSIRIGRNVTMLSRFSSNLAGLMSPNVLHCIGEGSIEIGDNSGLSSTVISAKSSVKIGKNVKIGCNVRIYDHDFHPFNYIERRALADGKKAATEEIVIGDDVFIGANSIILKGAKIGNRSIVGAGSVVAGKEIPPDSLAAGNPAKIIKQLA